jgi:phospholipid/cholesterol/gamma-HCH transport system substrate-binding protein
MTNAVRGGSQVLKYIAIAVVVLLLVGLVYLLTGGGTKTGTAYFKLANSIYPGDSVSVLGMEVGKVDKLTPEGDRVRVDFHYDSKYKLPADVKAAILSPTLVATRFIQLDPAYTTGPEFPDAGVIPIERTAMPLEFDELKKQLELISTEFGPNGMNKEGAINRALTVINKNGVQNGVGQGKPFHEMIVELSKAAKTLSDGRGDLFGTVDNLAKFSSVLVQYDKQIVEFQKNLGEVSRILAENDDAARKLLPTIDEAGKRVDEFVEHHGDRLTETIERAGSISRALAKVRDSIAQTLHVGPNALTNFTNLFHPRTGQLYGSVLPPQLGEAYVNSFASPGNQICALISGPAYANPMTAQEQCVKLLGPLYAQLGGLLLPAIQGVTPFIPDPTTTILQVPHGSTPPYGDISQPDNPPDVDPSPNGSNADGPIPFILPRSQTSPKSSGSPNGGNDRSYTDPGFPLPPVPTMNPKIPPLGGN